MFEKEKKEGVKKPAKKKKKKTSREKIIPEQKPAIPGKETPPLIKEPIDEPPPPPSTKKDDSLPITPTDHFGGAPTAMHLNGEYLYVSFGRKLVFFDRFLNDKGFVNLEAQAEELATQKSEDEIVLYVKEDGNILEIVSLPKGKGPEIVKSFQVDGPFDFSKSSRQLFVYLADRVQVLDLSKPEDVNVLFEIPVAGAHQAYSLGDYLYIAQGSNLNVVSKKSLSVLSSIPLDTNFEIVGNKAEKGTDHLILALKSPKSGKIKTIQFMTLVSGGGGVADFGQGVELEKDVDEIFLNEDQLYLTLLSEGKLGLFDLKNRVELKGPDAPIASLKLAQGGGGVIFAASSTSFGRFEYQISQPPKSPASAKPDKKKEPVKDKDSSAKPDVAGLAVDAPPEKKPPSYKFQNEKIVPLAGSVSGFLLLGNDSALLINNLAKDHAGVAPLFYSKSFSTNTSHLNPLWIPNKDPADFTLVRPTKYGVFLYDAKKEKVFLVKNDFSAVVPLNVSVKSIVGMDIGSDGKSDYLYLTTTDSLVSYKIESTGSVSKKGSLTLKEAGGLRVFNKGKKAIVACGSGGVHIVELSSGANQMKLVNTIPSSIPKTKVLDVVLSPNKKIAYLFVERSGENHITLFDLKASEPSEISDIKNISMDQKQFRGITFSAGGNKLIVPNRKGLRIFDVKNPKKPTLLFDWPLGRVNFADVTNRGMIVCAALGENGVECGEFTPTPKN